MELKSRNTKWLLVVCLLVVSSCLWQKRVYNKGYYVSKNHSLKKPEDKTNTDTMPSLVGSITPVKVKEVPVTLSAEIPTKKEETKHSKLSAFFAPLRAINSKLNVNACDTLFLRNGAQILVKVTDVNSEKVKYTFCDSPNKFFRTINKADINYIVYANGYKEVYDGVQQGQTQYSNNDYDKQHKARNLAIIGLVFLIVGIALCLLLFIPSFGLGLGASVGAAGCGAGCLSLFFGIIFFITGIILFIIALVTALST